MKKISHMDTFLDEVRKVPIIQVACEKSGISRNTVYRWKREDSDFAKRLTEAEAEGVSFVNDMSESQLLQLIKDRKFSAIRLWLTNNHQRFANKPLRTQEAKHTELSDEQKDTIKQALQYANLIKSDHE